MLPSLPSPATTNLPLSPTILHLCLLNKTVTDSVQMVSRDGLEGPRVKPSTLSVGHDKHLSLFEVAGVVEIGFKVG